MHDSLMDNVSDPRLENVLGSVAVAITGPCRLPSTTRRDTRLPGRRR